MSLVTLVETYTGYMFPVFELILANGHWPTGAGTAIWNRLPPALYGAKTVSEFKKLYCML